MPILAKKILPLTVLGAVLMNMAQAEPEARVIVKWRDGSSLALKQAQSAERTTALARVANLNVRTAPEFAPRMQVVRASGISAEELASRLLQQGEVEYAEPDRMKKIRAVPNDPLLGSQWYLQNLQYAAINAVGAWDFGIGLPGVTVAVIDTGITAHVDLAARLLPGYDFISDAAQGGDGNGWDSDPSDAGDGLAPTDVSSMRNPNSTLYQCGSGANGDQPIPSNWHGTKVAGIVAAAGNNGVGIAGVAWGVNILPVRAMGKCGGRDSDILTAMRWAAGLPIGGVPTNTHPARIINLSLGGQNTCTAAWRDVMADMTRAGVLVVAAAGNEPRFDPFTGAPLIDEPGNCPGVLAVAGVRHEGNKVGYSSFGAEVGISAPAGNCVNTGGACLFPINTTSNSGTYTPATPTYTDSTDYTVGTSFATPMAAGVAGLMWSVHADFTPALLIQRLKSGARSFVADPALPTCPQLVPDSDVKAGQCNCTTSTCGAGLLNAFGAVGEALRPVARATVSGGGTTGLAVTLDASGSEVATGRSIASYRWSAVQGDGSNAAMQNGDKASASVVPDKAGQLAVTLQITDDSGRSDTVSVKMEIVAAAPGTGGSGSGSGTGTDGSGSTGSGTGSGSGSSSGTPATTGGGQSDSGGKGGGGSIDLIALLGLAALLLGQRRPRQ